MPALSVQPSDVERMLLVIALGYGVGLLDPLNVLTEGNSQVSGG